MKVPISKLKTNPDNPRFIKDEAFAKLVNSLKEFPEMLDTREIVVNKDYVILGGNMRYRAAKEIGLKEVPVKVVDWSEDKQREFIIKDNVAGGEWDWDLLANGWEVDTLAEWGIEFPPSVNPEDFGTEFALPDDDKAPYQQMTFTVADAQAELIKGALNLAKSIDGETFGNENSNGNALYWIVQQWVEQKK